MKVEINLIVLYCIVLYCIVVPVSRGAEVTVSPLSRLSGQP